MSEAHPAWFDPSTPRAEHCVLPGILERHAESSPDEPCVRFPDRVVWTYSDAWRAARDTAAALMALGAVRGDRILVWLPNDAAFLRVWFGISALGAVFVPINTAWRGSMIEHVIRDSGAKILICHTELLDHLVGLNLATLDHVVACGQPAATPLPVALHSESVLNAAATTYEMPRLTPADISSILYTSGTTGRSKGVLMPYGQIFTSGMVSHGYLKPGDVIYVFLPLFHTIGLCAVYASLANGACLHLARRFRAQTFWDDVRSAGCNRVLGLISSITGYLATTVGAVADCPFDFAMMSPITEETSRFAERCGFAYFSAYGMTELSVPLVSPMNSKVLGSCGRPRTGVDCKIVDANDNEVPVGQVGELVIRSAHPSTMNAGYLNDSAATQHAWRNGWFHSGDAFRRDASGNYYFLDRMQDTIRRRGENISSMEVEREIAGYLGVMEVAVIGVPTPHGDSEVMAVLSAAPGHSIRPEDLVKYLASRLAHFMIPRYVRLMPTLPKTPTNKIRKSELRASGVAPDTWDRETSGGPTRQG